MNEKKQKYFYIARKGTLAKAICTQLPMGFILSLYIGKMQRQLRFIRWSYRKASKKN